MHPVPDIGSVSGTVGDDPPQHEDAGPVEGFLPTTSEGLPPEYGSWARNDESNARPSAQENVTPSLPESQRAGHKPLVPSTQ